LVLEMALEKVAKTRFPPLKFKAAFPKLQFWEGPIIKKFTTKAAGQAKGTQRGGLRLESCSFVSWQAIVRLASRCSPDEPLFAFVRRP
jgi:hypothetical protein